MTETEKDNQDFITYKGGDNRYTFVPKTWVPNIIKILYVVFAIMTLGVLWEIYNMIK